MTENCDIWITREDHDRLMAHLFPGDVDEHGAILSAGVVEGGRGLRLLVSRTTPAVDGEDYLPGEIGYRALTPTFIHRNIIDCRDRRMAYLAVHNHHADKTVSFSATDMASHERGYPALRDIGKGIPVGALVYGRRSVEADVWLADGRRLVLGEYRIIGDTVERLYSRPRSAGSVRVEHDRQVRMFGSAGQQRLRGAKVAVVGLGGIGSLVVEYLSRLGVGDFVLIDPDRIENSNLSRVVGATPADVEAALLKVEIAVRHIRESGDPRNITAIADDVVRPAAASLLRDCDFIFLAADSMRARLLVNAVAHQYFVPVIQLGAKVRTTPTRLIDEAMSVVRHVRPGSGCLWCNGWIDASQLSIELKSDEERKDQAYGTFEPNPSVITLNAVAAAHGVNDFLFDFLGLRPNRSGGHAYEHHMFVAQRIDHAIPRRDPFCRECVGRFGVGDAAPLPTIDD